MQISNSARMYGLQMNSQLNQEQIGSVKAPVNNDKYITPPKKTEKVLNEPCQTCDSRLYVDGSNDPGVSFKTPTNISPGDSFSKVASHENEHVANNKVQAYRDNREVVSQSVTVFTAVCPECGKRFASGGQTVTITKGKEDKSGTFVDTRV